ncbi:tape measure protein [Corynebacterium glyciniphilum]|uniref:tape measure protein n=1 Tax=Corynebacterium glyciniphilum TaxID=1404244 RepID=UPI003FCF7FA5
MSVEIASAYVSLSADTRQIPKDVKKALGQAEGAASSSGQSIGQKISSGLGKTLKAGALTGGAAAGAALGMSLKKGFDRLSAIEQSEAKLTGLGHSTESVAKIMDNALGSVKGTAYGLGDAASVAAGMVAAGIKPGKELEGVLKTMGDTAAIAGRDLTDVGLIFQSVAAKGKLQGDDMLQLMSSGIPVLQLLADELGTTSEEVSEMVSKGEIDFATFEKAMKKGMGGAALEAGKTFKGSMDNMGAAMGRFGETLLKGAFNKAPEVIGNVTAGIDLLNDKVGGAIELFSTGDFTGDIASKLGVDEDSAVVDRILSAREAVEKLSGAVELFVKGDFNGGIREKLGVEEDSPLVDQILTLRDVFADWGERVGKVFRELGDLAMQLAPAFGSIAASLGKATAKVSAATWEALLRIVEALVPVLEKVLVPVFEKLAKAMEEHPGLVTALVGAFAGLKIIKLVSGPLKMIGGIAKGASGGFKLLSGALGAGKAAGKGGKIGAALLHIAGGAKSTTPAVAKMGGAASKAVGGLTLFGRIGAGLSKVFGPVTRVLGGVVGKLGMKGLLGIVGKVALKFVPFIGWIWTAYEALKWFFTKTELGKKVFEGLKNVLSNVWNWIKDTFVAGFQWAGDKLGSMWDGITGAWSVAWDGITGFISDSWERLKTVWDTVGQPVVDFIVSAWDKIYIGIRIAFNIVRATFEAAWIAIGMIWQNVGQPQVDRVKYAFEMLWTGIKTVFGWIRSGWDWLWQGLQNAYNAYIVPVIDWIKSAFQSLKDGLSWYWETMKQNWSNLWSFIQRMYDTYVQPIVDGVVNAFNRMRDGVVAAWDWIKTKIQEFASWVGGKISEIGTVIMGLYHQHVAPLVDYIRGGIDRIVSFFTGMKDRLLGALSGAKEWLVQAGKWLIEGLWNGIKSMGSWITDKLTSWIPDKIKKPFENVLEFGSPSKLFKQYGKWLIEGLAIGVDSMGNKIEKSMVGIADRVAGVDMPTVQVSAQLNDQGLNVEASAQNVSAKVTEANPAPSSRYEGGAPPAVQSVEQGTESFEASSEAVNASVQATFDPAVQQADLSMSGFGANVQATATGVVTPQWQGMANNVAMAANGVIAPAFGAVQAGLSNTGARFVQQTTGVMTPMWNSMGANVARVRQAVTDPAMAGIRSALSATGAHFTNSVNGTINPVWNAMGTNVQRVWTGTVNPAFNAIAGGLQNTVRAFDQGATGIANQWNRVRRATADPVKFAIESVFNNGIVGMWNSARELLGTKKMARYTNYAFATGGKVNGTGTATSDSIPALLSNGEYVIKASSVRAIGEKNLDAMNSGKINFAANAANDRTFKKVAVKRAGGGIVKGTKAWSQLKRGYDWAKSRSGRPYVWGGSANGSGGTDCSGFMSGIADVIMGGSGARQWATMSFPGPQQGAWRNGLGAGFSVGIVNGGPYGGHTAGTIGGVEGMPATNVESGGSPSKVKFGAGAVGADHSQFATRHTMIVTDAGAFKVGIGGAGGGSFDISGAVADAQAPYKRKIDNAVSQWNSANPNGLVNKIPSAVAGKQQEALDKKIEKYVSEMSTTLGGDIPGGAGAERWRPMSKRAMARTGFNAGDKSQVDAMVSQIQSESGGNPRAVQNGYVDVNTGGNEAAGLLQVIPGTFAAHRDPALPNDRFDPFASMNAALRYYKSKYGMNLTTMWGHGHGYDNGGYLQPGMTKAINASGKPEPVFTHKQWQILKGNIMSAAQAGDLKKLQVNLGIVANGLQQAVAKLDWQEIFGAASKAFNDKFFEDQAADVRSVFGIPDPDSIPAVKAFAEFRENEKKLNEEQAQAAKDSREAATRADSAADKISGAPVPVKAKSESVSVGSQVARTGALVSRALANPNPVSVGAAAKSGGDTIQFIVRNEEAAWSEYRKFQAKNSRGRVGAR